MPSKYKVKQGDCISSIAEKYGLDPNALWNHPDNRDLKDLRKDPNVLYPDDVVAVPDKEAKNIDCQTDQTTKIKKKGVPAFVRLRLTLDDEPRKNEPWSICIDGAWQEGTTDGDGYLKVPVPPKAKKATLVIGEGAMQETYELNIGSLDPIDTDEGVRERLAAIGIVLSDDLAADISKFQSKEQITESGQLDDATKAKLVEVFGQ